MSAAYSGSKVGAVVPFYGLIPWEGAKPDFSKLEAPVQGHFAELDGFFGPDLARGLETEIRDAGGDASIQIHPGVDHAFFNDTRPEVYNEDESAKAWADTIAFFGEQLG